MYAALQPVVDTVARLLFRIEVQGLERVPRAGPAVLMANHVSHLDPLVLFSVATRADRRPRFLALADLWDRPGLGWLLDAGRMIPVFRGKGQEAVDHMVTAACRALDDGQLVVVYPEGQLPDHDAPQRPRRGAGRLALATSAPVLPVVMRGVPPWTGRPPRPRTPVSVRVGAPLELDDLRGQPISPGTERVASQRAVEAFADTA